MADCWATVEVIERNERFRFRASLYTTDDNGVVLVLRDAEKFQSEAEAQLQAARTRRNLKVAGIEVR